MLLNPCALLANTSDYIHKYTNNKTSVRSVVLLVNIYFSNDKDINKFKSCSTSIHFYLPPGWNFPRCHLYYINSVIYFSDTLNHFNNTLVALLSNDPVTKI